MSAVAFGANPATSFTVNSPTSITAVAPAGINGTNVSVTVTNPVGPSSGGANTYYYGVPTLTLLTPAAGAAGGTNTVTITGTNFVTGATVLFGANAGTSVNVVNSTTITVVAPAGTAGTTVDVTVTTPAGISATSAASKYSYGVPTVTLLAPTNGPAAGGTSVVITGTGFTGVSAVAFGANPATSFTVNSPTSITAVAPAGINGTNVSVTVTNPVGPSSGGANTYYYGVPTLRSLPRRLVRLGVPTRSPSPALTSSPGLPCSSVPMLAPVSTSSTPRRSPWLPQRVPPAPPWTSPVTTPAGISATSAASKYSYGVPTVTLLAPTNGPAAGTNTVTITGTGFTGLSGAGAVMFGANNATSYVVNSPTSITALVPVGVAGTVRVIVTNPVGPSAANPMFDQYTYN